MRSKWYQIFKLKASEFKTVKEKSWYNETQIKLFDQNASKTQDSI